MNASVARGFALIELLVVITIIGMLSAIAMASYAATRERANDTRRFQDVRELEKALSLYLITNNIFPISVGTTTLTGADPISTALLGADVIPAIPTDPRSPVFDYEYSSNAAGTDFTLHFCLETNTSAGYSQGCGNTISP